MVELLDFYADWCPPCQQMRPVFEGLEKEFEGRVEFKKIDVDSEGEKAAEFKVLSIPTFVILENGQEVGRKVGALSKEVFVKWLEESGVEDK